MWERSSQRCFHFVASQRLWKNLPLLRRFDVQRGIVVDFLIEQQVAIKMTKRRKLSSYAAAIHLMGKKLLQEVAHIDAARRQQQALTLFQKFRELAHVGGVSADGKRRQSFLDSQIVEKAGEHARVCFRSHEPGRRRVCTLSDADKSDEADALGPEQPNLVET